MERILPQHDFGAAIRERRRELGMSQTMLARRLRVSRQQMDRYERGKGRLNVQRIQAVATALRVDVSYFFPEDHFSEKGHVNSFERTLVERFRSMDQANRDIFIRLVALATLGESCNSMLSHGVVSRPLTTIRQLFPDLRA